MTPSERCELTLVIFGIVIILFFCYATIKAVLGTANDNDNINTLDNQEDTVSLSASCRHLYDVGKHEEWAECMGVGYK